MKLLHDFPPRLRLRDKRNRAGAVTCRLLLSPSLSYWLAEGEGGRREGLGEKAVLFGQSAGTFTSCQQELRARRALPSSPAHTTSQLSICLQFFGTVTTKTPCVSGGREAAVHSSGRRLTSRSRLRQLDSSLGFPLS